MEEQKCIITDLNTLCNNCGFFESESSVNSGYGCLHTYCGDGEFLNKKGEGISEYDWLIAESLSKRKIRCNRRLAKKMIKKTRKMNFDQKKECLKRLGFTYYGKCYSFTCPISWEVEFESIKNYENSEDYDHLESEEEMPWGFGDELMGLEIKEAEKMNIF
ncbi:hypothetical protein ACJRPK_14025 [Aquimarina sp. 2-A2]|uniref:hypothetical protein n=1 Tax=Aquimarina sp. 2-A2 TaxID=3382644 RepID=UPI00387F31AE